MCERVLEYYKQHPIHSVVIDDKEAAQACLNFLGKHRILRYIRHSYILVH